MDRRPITKGSLILGIGLALCLPAFAAADTPSAVRTASGLLAKNDGVFAATIVEGGKEFGRTRVVWSAAKETGRKASYAVTYSFGAQVQGVKAPSTVRALYYDRATNTNVLAPLSFIRQTSEKAAPAAETERFFHVSTDASVYPLFAGERLPYSAAKPVITGEGVGDALLASMYYDPAVYSIVASRWDGTKIVSGGQYGRWAVYTLHRTSTTYSAIYAANVPLPDVRVYDGVAYYSADASAVAAAEASENASATTATPATHAPAGKPTTTPRPIWPFVAAAAAALASTGPVAFWYRRGKRRVVEEGDEFEDEITDGEFDATGENADE